MYNKGVEQWPLFHVKNLSDGLFAVNIARQPVHRFRGQPNDFFPVQAGNCIGNICGNTNHAAKVSVWAACTPEWYSGKLRL
jgi:hypothetical protein